MHLIPGQKYRLNDVLWWTRQKDVFAEIAAMKGLDSADSNTPGWFTLHWTAEKNILDAMTEVEKRDITKRGRKVSRGGFTQRHSMQVSADGKWCRRGRRGQRQ